MEMINIPKAEYEKMIKQITLLKKIEQVDINLVKQFHNSLSDIKNGKVLRVA